MSNNLKGLVLLIEPDPRFVPPAEEALKALSGDLHAMVFPSFEEMLKWTAAPADPELPENIPAKVRLILLPMESLAGPDEVPAKISALAAAGIPATAPLILTAFGSAESVTSKWAGSGAFTMLVKPYDELLLQQHLRLAFGAGKPSGEGAVFVMKTTSMIESLKTVPMTHLSEIGFITRSEIALPPGRVTKFYSPIFAWGALKSVYARVQAQEADGKFQRVRLTWFGTGRDQLLAIRGRFPASKEVAQVWEGTAARDKARFLIIADPNPAGADLAGTLQRNFQNAEVLALSDVPAVNIPYPIPLDAVFVHKGLLEKLGADPRFKDIPRIAMSEKALNDEELRALKDKCVDIVTVPLERSIFMKKMVVLFPALKPSEARSVHTYEHAEAIHVGQPVEITEMSEGGLIERYERALPVGTVRKFVLWFPSEMDLPTLIARCSYTTPDPSRPGAFLNSFVFFGMSDRETKHVRIWMRDNYIKEKQKS